MPLLKVDSVAVEFSNRKILRDVALQCATGEILGMLGRNGSGKSTLLKVIFGTLTPAYKYMSIDDKYVAQGYKTGRIAYLSQQSCLPKYAPVSKLADLMVAERYIGELKAMDIYRKHAAKRCSELSGGELRQLEMLILLYSNTDFVLLDEPFTHITPVQCEYFKQVMRKVAQTKGIIVTDHQYRNILEVSDRLILMDNGVTRPITDNEDLVCYQYLSSL